MLSQDELTHALHDGLKAAERCSDTFCRSGASVVDEGYTVWHNGVSSSTTDVQRVHATVTLGKSREQLAERIKTWVAGLHTGIRVDLNVAMATGGPVFESAYLVGEWGTELFVPDAAGMIIPNAIEMRGPSLTGWPWTPDHFGHVEQGA